jgi:hypothetical protein
LRRHEATPVTTNTTELELHKIKRSMHHEVIRSFRLMLYECEARAIELDDSFLKEQVQTWYKQWNRMTGANDKAKWCQDPTCSPTSSTTP